jgi:hypothetical protein
MRVSKKFLYLRVILFLFGGGIVFLSFHLLTAGRELIRDDYFMWLSIAAMYLTVFLPFFFSAIRIGNVSEKVPSLVMVWSAVFIYVPASIIMIILLNTGVLSFRTALIVQAVLAFLFFLGIYFGYFADFHVQNAAAEEADIRQYLDEIKAKARSLSLYAKGLGAGYEEVQKIVLKAIDDINYISPVRNNAGLDTEIEMLLVMDSLIAVCKTITDGGLAGGHVSSPLGDAEKLRMLVQERKLLRN